MFGTLIYWPLPPLLSSSEITKYCLRVNHPSPFMFMPLFRTYVIPANENILFTSFSPFTSNQTILIDQMVTCATAHDDVVLSLDDSRLLLSL